GRIMRTPELVGRVALFVDSCMNEIPAINARDRSILNDFMLPHEVTLFYATADAGASEFIGPLAIKSCDSVAKRLMKLSPMPPNIGQAFHFPIPVEALSDSAPRARRT
ncbi:MAG: hypothetical protein L6Q76_13175, partial [Polyangiaceae bacterium]|nr:hypothetical protein [Polyangiaceae bacterium]